MTSLSLPVISEAGMRIMRLLIGRPSQTMADLTTTLNVTRTAITEQLDELIAIGYIEQKREYGGSRGRPRYRFSATERAMRRLFKGLHGIVVPATWRAIRKRLGNEMLDIICRDIAADIASSYDRQLVSKTPKERAKEFVTIQASLGRLIEFQESEEGIDVRKFNCPFVSMMDDSKTVCHIDKLSMNLFIGGNIPVEQVESRHDGFPCCTFRLPNEK